ncbi:MAG: hypothetical protein EOO06_08880 [Chitinophagaceae bacterium]|nr:MAG: hypothetical protein EOO06_08880 [Chitinophagaceae bacterium]
MKKILVAIAFIFSAAIATAQTETATVSYRFYPEVNVYYNPSTKTYSWFDQNRSSWTTGIQLPLSLKIKDENVYNTIKYQGTEIWSSNPDHIKMYGSPAAPPANPRVNTTAPEKPLPPAE